MKIKKIGIVILVIVGILILSAAILLATNTELRNGLVLLTDPNYFRNIVFFHYRNETGQDIYLLGTIHSSFMTNDSYSLWNLKAVIVHLNPDLLLVESRPEELTKDNIGDGPIEMPFATLTANAYGIETQGMDWWTMDSDSIDNDVRENHMFDNIVAEIAGHNKVLIFTGWSHVEGFNKRFLRSGYQEIEFPSSEKQALFDTTTVPMVFPKGLTHYIEQRIELDRQTLAGNISDYWKAKLENAIDDRKRFLDMIKRIGEQ